MDMKVVSDAIEDLGRTFEEFKRQNDERLRQIETRGRADPELEAKVDRINADLTSIASRMARSGPGITQQKDFGRFNYKDSYFGASYDEKFGLYVRKGEVNGLAELEQKALSVGSDPDGGYTVVPEMSQRIATISFETSPVRTVATVETIGSSSLEILVDNDDADAGWVSETQSRSETATPKLGKKEIVVHELYANPAATQKLLDDANIDVEAWLGNKLGNKFGRLEATAFVLGDGVGKPRGFLTYPAGMSWGQIEQVNSGDAAAVTADGLIDLVGALKYAYRTRAVWMMNRDTVSAVRKLKDPATGAYMWQPGLVAAQPEQLLGYALYPAADMPSVAAAALPVAFGDFSQAYTVVDRVGIRVLRDPYTSKPNVLFYSTKRVGGDVVNFEAIKLQTISA